MMDEQVGGSSLASLISQRLTGPLGVLHTFLPPASDSSLPAPAAHGYLNQQCLDLASAAGAPPIDPQSDTTSWNNSYFAGAAGMTSTINDLGTWASSNLGTSMLSANLVQERL